MYADDVVVRWWWWKQQKKFRVNITHLESVIKLLIWQTETEDKSNKQNGKD